MTYTSLLLKWAGPFPDYNYLTPARPGGIYMNRDGGNTWETLIDSVATFYRSIGFVDSLTGWVGNLGAGAGVTTDTNFLYQTNDGGHTWQVVNVPGTKPPGICGIYIINDSSMYACGTYYGPPRLLKTTNKGKTWTNIDMSPYAHGLVDMHFTSPDTGFVIGSSNAAENAVVLHTTDGGATWDTLYLHNKPSTICWKIVFPSKNVGYVSIQRLVTQGSNYFLKTTDGGVNWTLMSFPNANYNLEGIGFINDSVGWIGGDNYYKNYKTTNGGVTWVIDNTFGKEILPYNGFGPGSAMNRFRRFGDTLMYASGNTVYKYSKQTGAGIAQMSEERNSTKIFPNPFTQSTTIDLGKNKGLLTISIYNLIGQCVKTLTSSNSTILIDRTGLENGLYLYKAANNISGLISQGKLIVE